MKILHVNLEMYWGGGEKQLIQFIEESPTDNAVICCKNSRLHAYCKQHHSAHYCLNSSSPYHPLAVYQFIRAVKDFGPDIIHLHTSKAHTIGLIARWFYKSPPLIVTRRMSSPLKKNAISRYKYSHPSIQKIICVSNAVKNVVSEVVNQDRIITIYGGINISQAKQKVNTNFLLRKGPLAREKTLVGFVGSLTAIKDPLLFIEVASKMHQQLKGILFLIIGEGKLKPVLEAEIKKRNLGEVILLAGYTNEPIAAISSLDLLLITSENEGIPNVILEAFVAGTPVVSVKVGGIPELINEDLTGMLTKRDAEELANKSIRVLNDPSLSEQLKENALLKVHSFSSAKGIDQTIKLYEEILSKN